MDTTPASRKLLDVDWLVFSSHKTATQSLTRSLKATGLRAEHCHRPDYLGLGPGELADFLRAYRRENGRPLRVLSVFREPMERMISSFFQYHGVGAVRSGRVATVEDTIIFQKPPAELADDFVAFVERFDGFGESLHILADELDLPVRSLRFSEASGIGHNDLPDCELVLGRFDRLTADFHAMTARMVGRPIELSTYNLREDQWYADRCREFEENLRLPATVVRQIYESRRALVEVFYPDRYDALLESSLTRFGGPT